MLDPAQTLASALQYHRAGNLPEAERLYKTLLAQNPQNPDALHLLGALAIQAGKPEMAVQLIRNAIAIRPDVASYHNHLGTAETQLRNYPEAIASLQEALRLKPDYPEAWNALGIVFHELYDARAEECFRKALHLRAGYTDAMSNLGKGLAAHGKIEESISLLRQAIQLRPDFVDAHWNLAWALLLDGQYPEGWQQYEWRWKLRESPFVRTTFSGPQWKGEEIRGKRLLVHPEQGFGDILQFTRFLRPAAELGAKIILEVPLPLCRLLEGIENVTEIVTYGEPLPPYDLHCPVMSLPLALGITLDTIPPPLQLPRFSCEMAAANTAGKAPLRVGLIWAGNPKFTDYRKRSISLNQFLPLGKIPNVLFYSLTKENAAEQIAEVASQLPIVDLCSSVRDFADTAAHIAQLDLVIATDTAVAHLAGTMNKPVWLLIPQSLDWRWLMHREDSP